jgi:hypothetical protein
MGPNTMTCGDSAVSRWFSTEFREKVSGQAA